MEFGKRTDFTGTCIQEFDRCVDEEARFHCLIDDKFELYIAIASCYDSTVIEKLSVRRRSRELTSDNNRPRHMRQIASPPNSLRLRLAPVERESRALRLAIVAAKLEAIRTRYATPLCSLKMSADNGGG